MDKESDDQEQENNSSDEESDFESADEGENDTTVRTATSADMMSEESTSSDSAGRGAVDSKQPDEMCSQETSEPSPQMAAGKDSSADGKSEGTSQITKEDNTEIAPNSENPPSEPSVGQAAPDGETDEASREKKSDGNPVMAAGFSQVGGQMSTDEDQKSSTTNDNEQDTKMSAEPDITGNPSKDQGESVLNVDKSKQAAATQGGWGWGGWLSQATASVTSGLTSVIETMETSLGVPDPNEMAKKVKEEEDQLEQESEEGQERLSSSDVKGEGTGSFLSSLGVSALTNVVQNRGMELVSGGLDALEFIGKRTMDVLSEGDPAQREERVQLLSKGPTLSQMLREGKAASEAKATHRAGQENRQVPAVDVFTKFEEHQGMAHLEALEILSHESESQVESQILDLAAEDLNIMKPVLRALEEAFHFEDDNDDDDDDDDGGSEDNFESTVAENISALNLNVHSDKLISTQKLGKDWLDACVQEQDTKPGSRTGQDIYEAALGTMGELTARTVELFHKVAELVVYQGGKECQTSALVRARCIRRLTDAVSRKSASFATHFSGCLNTTADDAEDPSAVSSLITNIYLDSSTCSSYLCNSSKLLCPVLQLSSLNENRTGQEGMK